MLAVFAPHPAPESGMILPNFSLGDTERMDSEIIALRRYSGGLHTHVKKQLDSRILSWNFVLTRMKALEFKDFYREYAGKKWRFLDLDDDDSWIGYVKVNPTSLNMVSRGKIADSEDTVLLEIEFETTEL